MQCVELTVAQRATQSAACLALAACIAGGCADSSESRVPLWTVDEAKSITSIRGHQVRVRYCHGVGRGERGDTGERYRRFDCLAGTRTKYQRYDTVGVFYVLHPLEKYEGRFSRHRLTNVRFVGGPGVP